MDQGSAAQPICDLKQLLKQMNPALQSGVWVFCVIPHGSEVPTSEVLGIFKEKEGVTVIVAQELAIARGWTILFRAAWIVLQVPSDLLAVGFLAAVTGELARQGLSCNPVSAACHDHLFVPYDKGGEALKVLLVLQERE